MNRSRACGRISTSMNNRPDAVILYVIRLEWNQMRRLILIGAILILAPIGCRSLPISPNADRDWIHDFQRADKIVILHNRTERTINDPAIIERLTEIYTRSKFETYWHTVPNNLGKKSIEIFANDNLLRKISYTGDLWEHSPDKPDRTAKLKNDDRKWIESLFE